MPSVWELYTKRARKLVFYAQDEAAARGGTLVDTEHLLLGLIVEPDNNASLVMARMNVSSGKVRQALLRLMPPVVDRWPNFDTYKTKMELTKQGNHVLNLAKRECDQMSDEKISTEHVLLGLLLEDGSSVAMTAEDTWPPAPTNTMHEPGLARHVLTALGLTADLTRSEIAAWRQDKADREIKQAGLLSRFLSGTRRAPEGD